MSKPYKLSAVLMGHSLDVRGVSTTSDNCILSGSRDTSAKFWRPNGFNTGYTDVISYKEQKKFVIAVLYLEPTVKSPEGWVVVGGNDNTLFVYKPSEPFASLALKEHTNAVCKLSKGLEENSFLSGSWDSTAKYWCLDKSKTALVSYQGHTAAVWGVIQLQNSNIVTASADKTIGLWSKDGHRMQTITGHTDCVRDLSDFPELTCFVSVSNDASIKVWSYAGENVHTYYGHTSFIYSIARNKAAGENCFITSDEDRTVRCWLDGQNVETFQLPAQSVWTVSCLSNGDIVTGSSDGIVRVFTQNEGRYASEEAIKAFEDEVNALKKQALQEIGGIKVSDLPGIEALYEPGKKEGQMKMIREAQGVVAYTWVENGENSHWEKVGDVLGGASPSDKTTYEGKQYDYVFSVDVEDGKPPLKLPYNKGDDPYMAAHTFLEKNFLPAEYLDQVVDFILKNSQEANSVPAGSDFVDPFTGASRYTPSSSSTKPKVPVNADPFTGSSSYTTISSYFPLKEYRTFDMGDMNLILSKLKEFNTKCNDSIDDDILENAVRSAVSSQSSTEHINVLFHMLSWPDELVFPVIDVMRMAVKYEKSNSEIAMRGSDIIGKLMEYLSPNCSAPNNVLVSLRFLCNLCTHNTGEQLLYESRIDLLENITSLKMANKNIQVATSTLLLNMSLMSMRRNDEIGVLILSTVIPDRIAAFDDPEAQFRSYVALGTLLSCGSDDHKKMIKEKIKENHEFVKSLERARTEGTNEVEVKRKQCASQLISELE